MGRSQELLIALVRFELTDRALDRNTEMQVPYRTCLRCSDACLPMKRNSGRRIPCEAGCVVSPFRIARIRA